MGVDQGSCSFASMTEIIKGATDEEAPMLMTALMMVAV